MKKLLICIITVLSGISLVNAKTVDINEIDTNTYIIGYRVFELNNYDISIYDVSTAIAEYVSINNLDIDEIKELPIYFYSINKSGVKKLEKITGSINGNLKVPVKVFSSINEVFNNGKLEVTYINDTNTFNNISDKEKINNYKTIIDNIINKFVIEINKQDGFSNALYNNNELSVEITDRLAASLNGAVVLSNIINDNKNLLDNNVLVDYIIKLPDNEIIKGKIESNKLNDNIKLLRDISKHLNNKNNIVKIELNISINNEKSTIKYNISIKKNY